MMRGMFSKRSGMKNCGATKFTDRKRTFREQNSKDGIYKVWLCLHAVEGNGNQNCSLIETRSYEAILLDESATKMINF